jgi:hypothetical protein
MTIYRTRYQRSKGAPPVSKWTETSVTAEFWRSEIERRFTGKKLEIMIDRFELNPSKSDIVPFLNEHAEE